MHATRYTSAAVTSAPPHSRTRVLQCCVPLRRTEYFSNNRCYSFFAGSSAQKKLGRGAHPSASFPEHIASKTGGRVSCKASQNLPKDLINEPFRDWHRFLGLDLLPLPAPCFPSTRHSTRTVVSQSSRWWRAAEKWHPATLGSLARRTCGCTHPPPRYAKTGSDSKKSK